MKTAAEHNRHGQIVCGTISVSDLDKSVAIYRDFLYQELLETGEVSAELAQAWGAENCTGARYAILAAPTEAKSYFRLVEVPTTERVKPATTLGWNAFELTVKDVFALAEHIEGNGFEIDGPPKLVDGFTSFIPMQVFGPDGEVLFLNQVNHSDVDVDLPIAQSEVGEIFIAVLASPDRELSTEEYVQSLGLDRAATHSLRYGLINRAFDLPVETKQSISMVQNKRWPILQVDQYPDYAEQRPQRAGYLPNGNSIISLLVESISDLSIAEKAIGPEISPAGGIYQGRKTQVIKGSAGELIELIEIN